MISKVARPSANQTRKRSSKQQGSTFTKNRVESRATFGQSSEQQDPLSAVLFGSGGSSSEFKKRPTLNSQPSIEDSQEAKVGEFNPEGQHQRQSLIHKNGMLTGPFTCSDQEFLMKATGTLNSETKTDHALYSRAHGSLASVTSSQQEVRQAFKQNFKHPSHFAPLTPLMSSNRDGTHCSSNYTTRSPYASPVSRSVKNGYQFKYPISSMMTTLSPTNSAAPEKHLSPTLKSLAKKNRRLGEPLPFSPNFAELQSQDLQDERLEIQPQQYMSIPSLRSSEPTNYEDQRNQSGRFNSVTSSKNALISELKTLLVETMEENKSLKSKVKDFEVEEKIREVSTIREHSHSKSEERRKKQFKPNLKKGKTVDKVRSMHTSPSHSKLIQARERLSTTAPQHRRNIRSRGSQSFTNLHQASSSSFNHTLSLLGEEDVKKLQGQVRALRDQASSAEMENMRLCQKSSTLELQLQQREQQIQKLHNETKERDMHIQKMKKEMEDRELFIQGQKAELIELQSKIKDEDEQKQQKSGLASHYLQSQNYTEGAGSSVPSIYVKQGHTGISSPNIATPSLFNQFTPGAVSHIDLAQRIREARMKGSMGPMNREGLPPLSTVDEQLIALANNYAYVSKNLQRELEVQKRIVKQKTLLLIESDKRDHMLRKEIQKKDLKIAMLRNERGGLREEIGKMKEQFSKKDSKYKALRARANKKLKLKNEHIAGLKKIIEMYEHGAPSSRQMQQSWMYPYFPPNQPLHYGYQPNYPPYPVYPNMAPQQHYEGLTPSHDGSAAPTHLHSIPPQPHVTYTQLPSPELSRIAKAMDSVNPVQSFCTAGGQDFGTPKQNEKNKTFSRGVNWSGGRSSSVLEPHSENRINRRSKSADYALGFPNNSLQSGGGSKHKSILVQQRLDALLKQAASLTKYSQLEDEQDQLLQEQAEIESKQSPLRKLLQQQNASPIIQESSHAYHSTQKTNEFEYRNSSFQEASKAKYSLGDSHRLVSVSVLQEGSRQPPLDPQYSFSKRDNDLSSILDHQEIISTPSKQGLPIQSMEEQVRYLKTRRENIERDLIHSEPRLSASGGTHSAASTPHRASRISPSQKLRQISQRS